MKILITGALNLTYDFRKEIESMGFEVTYVENERQEINFDVDELVGVICNSFFMYNDIKRFKNLKFIQLTSAGLDRVPVSDAKKMGVEIYNAKNVYSIPIAEWTILKILEIFNQSKFFINNQYNKVWKKNRQIKEIHESIVTIVGYGAIGFEIAKKLKSFGAYINAVDRKDLIQDDYISEYFHVNDLVKALKVSDIVIITLPLTNKTEKLFDFNTLSAMKDSSVIINVSRGAIIDEKSLKKLLSDGKFLGCALDVFEREPLPEDSLLWDIERVYLTPHNAFVSDKNQQRLYNVIIENLDKARKLL